MILQALNNYYQILLNDPESDIAKPGYSEVDVHLAVVLDENGNLLGLTSLMTEVQRGKKTVEIPIRLKVPERVLRSGKKIKSNVLWDNATYLLGISKGEDSQSGYTEIRHKAFKETNLGILSQAHCKASVAVRKFLETHDPNSFANSKFFTENVDILDKANLVFKIKGMAGYVHDDPIIRKVWLSQKADDSKATLGQCLITGEISTIELTHNKIKGVPGGQPAGTAIISFNDRAYESFNKTNQQGMNAPVSKEAMFGYSTALNHLLRDWRHRINLYDTTVVYWAESIDRKFVNIFNALLNPVSVVTTANEPGGDGRAEVELRSILSAIKSGDPLDFNELLTASEENTRFHVLGLSPNSARLSIRFYYNDPFRKAIKNLQQYHLDMKICNEYGKEDFFSIKQIIKETVPPKANKSVPAPLLTGAVFRSILLNLPFPAALYNATLIRIRADQDDEKNKIQKINQLRAAIIKAFLIRKYRHQEKYQEELTMSLNKDSTNQAYLLGRLFAVMERAQLEAAGKKLNATIKDRYFASACATPANVFPILLRLSQHHISKSDYGQYRDRDIQEIMECLDINEKPFPKHMSLDDQGIFVLGYYHQKADFFKKKPQTNNLDIEEDKND